MNTQFFGVLCLAVAAQAAPAADAGADPQLLAAPCAAAAAYHMPATNCKTENKVLITQTCVPSAEKKCSTEAGPVIIKQINEINEDGSYTIGYKAEYGT